MTRPLRLQPDHVKQAPARDVVGVVHLDALIHYREGRAQYLLSCFHLVPMGDEVKAHQKRRCSACAALNVPVKRRGHGFDEAEPLGSAGDLRGVCPEAWAGGVT
jgi:hypothetical protein